MKKPIIGVVLILISSLCVACSPAAKIPPDELAVAADGGTPCSDQEMAIANTFIAEYQSYIMEIVMTGASSRTQSFQDAKSRFERNVSQGCQMAVAQQIQMSAGGAGAYGGGFSPPSNSYTSGGTSTIAGVGGCTGTGCVAN